MLQQAGGPGVSATHQTAERRSGAWIFRDRSSILNMDSMLVAVCEYQWLFGFCGCCLQGFPQATCSILTLWRQAQRICHDVFMSSAERNIGCFQGLTTLYQITFLQRHRFLNVILLCCMRISLE